MTQVVSRRPPTPVAQVRVCGICGGQSGNERGFSQRTSGFPLSVSFHQCSTLISVYTLLFSEGQAGEILAPSKKNAFFQKSERIAQKTLSLRVQRVPRGIQKCSPCVCPYGHLTNCYLCVLFQKVKQIRINSDTTAPLRALS